MSAYLNISALLLFFNLANLAVYGLVVAVACQNIVAAPTNVIVVNAVIRQALFVP